MLDKQELAENVLHNLNTLGRLFANLKSHPIFMVAKEQAEELRNVLTKEVEDG